MINYGHDYQQLDMLPTMSYTHSRFAHVGRWCTEHNMRASRSPLRDPCRPHVVVLTRAGVTRRFANRPRPGRKFNRVDRDELCERAPFVSSHIHRSTPRRASPRCSQSIGGERMSSSSLSYLSFSYISDHSRHHMVLLGLQYLLEAYIDFL